jgi:hypothetical protein
MAREACFGVRLLAPSGKEQPVVLEVNHDGISFQQESGKASRRAEPRRAAPRRCATPPPRAAPTAARAHRPRAPRPQAIQHIPYASIIKWVPSSLRTRDPGGPDCLDIQVETTAGRRDLRMRCEGPAAVAEVVQAIRGTVQVGVI